MSVCPSALFANCLHTWASSLFESSWSLVLMSLRINLFWDNRSCNKNRVDSDGSRGWALTTNLFWKCERASLMSLMGSWGREFEFDCYIPIVILCNATNMMLWRCNLINYDHSSSHSIIISLMPTHDSSFETSLNVFLLLCMSSNSILFSFFNDYSSSVRKCGPNSITLTNNSINFNAYLFSLSRQ